MVAATKIKALLRMKQRLNSIEWHGNNRSQHSAGGIAGGAGIRREIAYGVVRELSCRGDIASKNPADRRWRRRVRPGEKCVGIGRSCLEIEKREKYA